MKKLIFTLIAAFCFVSIGFSQTLIKNDGATIKVQPGATLFVEGGIENTAGATIENDGTIEVQGNFLNNGTYDATDPNTLKFSGAANATFTPGTVTGTDYNAVEIAKTGGATVTLAGNVGIDGGLTFSGDNNRVVLGANNLTIRSGAAVTGHNATHFVVTNGAGAMTREGLAGATTFPVGYAATTYNPATLNAASGNMTVRAYGTPTDGDGESGTNLVDVVDAGWNITGTSPSADVTLQWAASDELGAFDRNNAAIGKNSGSEWDLLASDLGAAAGGDPYTMTRTGVTSFSNFAVGGAELAARLNLTLDVWLQGPYSGGSMSSAIINDIPLTEPHTALGYIQKAFGGGETTDLATLNSNNVSDWVLVEFRDAGNTGLIVGTKSGILTNTGMVANADGTVPFQMTGLAPASYYVVVKHRNHLAAMSAAPVDLSSGSGAFSFKTNAGVLGGIQANLSGGAFGLYHSDLDGNGVVDASDRALAWNDRNQLGYKRTDSDLSGVVDATDRANAWNNRNKTTAVPIGN